MSESSAAKLVYGSPWAVLKHRWTVVIACMIGIAACSTPVALLSLSVFIKPLGQAFGWHRGQIGLTVSVIALAMAIATPFAGRLIDKIGVKPVLCASLLLYGACLAATPYLITTFGIWGLYGAYLLIGVFGAGSNTVAYVHVLTSRFDRRRGLVLGLAMSGLAIGGAVNPALAASIIAKFGWTAGFYGLALVPLLIGFPIALLVIGEVRKTVHEAQVLSHGFDVAQALRTRVFWQLFFVFLIVAICLHGIQLHLPAMISDRSLSPQVSAIVLSLQFFVSAIIRVAAGFLVDRIFAPRIGAMLFVLSALGAATLIPVGDPLFYLVGAALIGVGAGAETDLLTYLASRYFGLKAVGQIFGLIFSAFMIGSALGPYLFGVGYDVFHSYWLNLTLASAGLFIASILLLRLPKFPAEFARQAGSSTH